MELWKKQKKILTAFGVFMLFMFLCTLISRSIYSSRLPQVTVDNPRKMAVSHDVTADGIVHQGREYAVTALAGLRVRTVYANVGDRVTEETLLFDLDTEDLKEKIQEQELAIKKIKLQISDMEQNRNLDAQKHQTEGDRAREDYTRTEEQQAENVQRASEDLKAAEDAYESHKRHAVHVTSDEDREKQQAAYDTWAEKAREMEQAAEQARSAYEAAQEKVKKLEAEAVMGEPESQELTDAREAEKQAETLYTDAEAARQTHMADPVKEPDFDTEDAEQSAWEEKRKLLEESMETARRTLEDAEQNRSDAMLDAGRKVADADIAGSADSTLEISRLELAAMQEKLNACQKVLDAGGQVYADAEGLITRVQVSPGERVGDGAAVVYADLASPMQFQVSLTGDQKKYVNQGDTARITLGNGSGKEYTVDYIAENDMNPELYDVRIFLPDGVGTIGQSGSFQVEAQSETFSCCIPISALYEDSTHRNFVYIVSERSGILGTELAAEKIYVKVLDRNDSYAAVEEGVIGQDTELIVSSTEELEDRDVIRYRE